MSAPVKVLLYARDQAAAQRLPAMSAEAWAPRGIAWPDQSARVHVIESGATPQAQAWVALAQTLAGGTTPLLVDLALAVPDEQSLQQAGTLLANADLVIGTLQDGSCPVIGLKRAVPELFTVPEFTAPMLRARARKHGVALSEFKLPDFKLPQGAR